MVLELDVQLLATAISRQASYPNLLVVGEASKALCLAHALHHHHGVEHGLPHTVATPVAARAPETFAATVALATAATTVATALAPILAALAPILAALTPILTAALSPILTAATPVATPVLATAAPAHAAKGWARAFWEGWSAHAQRQD